MAESTEDLKADGNRLFQQGRYQEAIDAYSKAIIRNPHVSTYFTNRALCHMNLKAWAKAAEDCSKAAFLDRNNVKAYYFGGRAAIQLGNYNEAIRLITKAKELANSQKMNFGDEIHAQMRLARREKFRVEEEKRVKEEGELQKYLRKLIEEDVARRIAEVLATESSAEGEANEEKTEKMDQITAEGEQHKTQLDSLFAQIDDRRRKREIPDFLCGKISCALLQDPVITPSGITYDRADIKQHLHRVGHFDPVTRAPLTEADLIPNLAMKEVLEHFLIENPWAKYEDLLS
ncbi:u-box domain protein [Oesophagostomum dentatum]|uniref:E3 ubiquitin-protein ligase CHIP n=1 Tax=Oesophagostomum dentatum TaxID=61180 RepID=A0A0B1TAW2_OESDE|nr:u-box domain protein [Oesophagostomum dentatum]